ncbi:helix-turn-helix domain-containing protein [Candidatus Bathyarchaeota archaeon]|nr:helix-turn-helix domain-containing protein [Candidatus Bathyarchaeota archaeon]
MIEITPSVNSIRLESLGWSSLETVVEDRENVVKLYDESTGAWKFVRKDRGPLRSIELIEKTFQKLGLSKNEIRVYVLLARSRERRASEISEALSLHRTETYRILRDLEKKGLVSSVFEKPLKFIATPFELAVDALIGAKKLKLQRLEREKKNLVDLWRSLPKLEMRARRKEVFQILEGEEQFSLKANTIIENTEREICVYASEEDLALLYHSGFIEKLENLAKKKFDVRFLTENSRKSRFFIEKMNVKVFKYAGSDVRDLPTFILTDQEQLLLTIRKNDAARGARGKSKIAALFTNYEAFVNALDKLFSELWKN